MIEFFVLVNCSFSSSGFRGNSRSGFHQYDWRNVGELGGELMFLKFERHLGRTGFDLVGFVFEKLNHSLFAGSSERPVNRHHRRIFKHPVVSWWKASSGLTLGGQKSKLRFWRWFFFNGQVTRKLRPNKRFSTFFPTNVALRALQSWKSTFLGGWNFDLFRHESLSQNRSLWL